MKAYKLSYTVYCMRDKPFINMDKVFMKRKIRYSDFIGQNFENGSRHLLQCFPIYRNLQDNEFDMQISEITQQYTTSDVTLHNNYF